MKKLLTLIAVCIFLFASCQRKRKDISQKKDWTDYRKGYHFLMQNRDSAFFYFNRVTTNVKDSVQIAMAYYNMATLQQDAGDNFGSQESLLMSLKYLDEKRVGDRKALATDYIELGLTSYNLQNYDDAISFYKEAIRLAGETGLTPYMLNNLANAYQKKKAYPQAMSLYTRVLSQKDAPAGSYARALTNLATTKWLANSNYNAAPELRKALLIRTIENDRWGQNSSYAHLADYYVHSKPDSALFFAERMYEVATALASPDDRVEALQKLIELGKPVDIKKYFSRYRLLSDSIQTARNAAKNQFALIRYQAEKNKADNLRLQKDNTDKKYQIVKQQVMLAGALLLIIGGSIGTRIWYHRRKRRLQLEAQNSIRENELKTSKKVHDVVANGLYRMMSDVENRDEIDKTLLLDQMEVLYERSRDISYEAPRMEHPEFHQKIADIILSFATPGRRVALVGNDKEFWSQTSPEVQYELEQVLQELMVNMKKHSRAGDVVVKFETYEAGLSITYSDDGVGFPENSHQGNGLTSTGNRINAVRGRIIFESKAGKGLKVQITLPNI